MFIRQIRDTVTVADGRQLLSQGSGRVQARFEQDIRINDVLYVPDLQANLLSIGQLAERGITCLFGSQGAYLRRGGEMLRAPGGLEGTTSFNPQGAHGALMTAGQDDACQEKELDAHTL